LSSNDRSSIGDARRMTVKRLDHVSIVVDDLDGAIAYFRELGLETEGRMPIEGKWVDRVNGIDGVRVEIVMMRAPDGGKLELTQFANPPAFAAEPKVAPSNVYGLRSVMFEVDNVDDTVARLRRHGGELIGEIANYEDIYRLCYVRGPAGIIVALAHALR
jgi:catechol 2,3-dioxygenase-like lactoylglutathione lyase family enzyme